jgi:hypothetical protein
MNNKASGGAGQVAVDRARLTPRVLAMAAMVYCPDADVSWATRASGRPGARAFADESRANAARAANTWKTS